VNGFNHRPHMATPLLSDNVEDEELNISLLQNQNWFSAGIMTNVYSLTRIDKFYFSVLLHNYWHFKLLLFNAFRNL